MHSEPGTSNIFLKEKMKMFIKLDESFNFIYFFFAFVE